PHARLLQALLERLPAMQAGSGEPRVFPLDGPPRAHRDCRSGWMGLVVQRGSRLSRAPRADRSGVRRRPHRRTGPGRRRQAVMGYGIPRAAVQDLGFADKDELLRMVQAVDLSTSTSLAAFVRWKHEDGTKE